MRPLLKNKRVLDASISKRKGWYFRGYLPHYDEFSLVQFVSYRLYDCVPSTELERIEQEISKVSDKIREKTRYARIDDLMDAGFGSCILRHPKIANIVMDNFLHFDGGRYRLLAWCIMPNHVHLLIRPLISLSSIVQSWKGYTGREILRLNESLGLGLHKRQVWMPDYWDRFIRDEQHFGKIVNYIHNNPVKAGLCVLPKDWAWSSAALWESGSIVMDQI